MNGYYDTCTIRKPICLRAELPGVNRPFEEKYTNIVL